MTPLRIDVHASHGHAYPVMLAAGLLSHLDATLDGLGLGRRRVVVSTRPLWRRVAGMVSGYAEPVFMPDGERFKTLRTVARLYEGLANAQADRATVVIAVGGGVVGDTAGFAAASFLRGLPLVHVPTTLLAQVDSAIGGKVGVNLPAGKNLVGAFHPPAAVIADPGVLRSLPRREFRAGLYEVVKYAVIASPALFDRLTRDLKTVLAGRRDESRPYERNREASHPNGRKLEVLVPIIEECCRIKARVVEEDEHEHGIRRTLNLGHTAGHALEAITHYRRFRHGEAVGYGMLAAGHLARARGALSSEHLHALTALISDMGPLPPVADLSAALAVEAIRHDKKMVDGRLHYVLPTGIGRTEIVTDVTEGELAAALKAIGLGE